MQRREFCLTGIAALCAAGLPVENTVAETAVLDQAIDDFVQGAEVTSGTIALSVPEIAENGNTVPVSVSVDSPMTQDDHVSEVLVLASGNPLPGVARFRFSPRSGQASASTRIRLAKTQDVIAIARMSSGAMFMDRKNVKVTIGGCGG
jgi:sulfur-oxidizing protein SoxY